MSYCFSGCQCWPEMLDLGPKWGKIGPKLDNLGLCDKMFWYLICPFRTNLAHFGPKNDILFLGECNCLDLWPVQGWWIWHPNWVRLARNGKNLGLFKIIGRNMMASCEWCLRGRTWCFLFFWHVITGFDAHRHHQKSEDIINTKHYLYVLIK